MTTNAQEEEGSTSSTEGTYGGSCIECPPGMECPGGGVFQECEPGTHAPGGGPSNVCMPCFPGTFANSTASAECTDCPAGESGSQGRVYARRNDWTLTSQIDASWRLEREGQGCGRSVAGEWKLGQVVIIGERMGSICEVVALFNKREQTQKNSWYSLMYVCVRLELISELRTMPSWTWT